MSRQAILRLLDTLFRRWWLYIVPVLLLAGVGFMSVKGSKEVYRSGGTISVRQGAPLITTLDGRATDPGFGYETPAGATAGDINSLVGTDNFAQEIATTAGLTLSFGPDGITLAEIQRSVSSFASGKTLVRVTASHEDPQIAQRLAQAAMETYTDWVVAGAVLDTQIAVDTLNARLEPYNATLDAAEADLAAYVVANPAPFGEANRDPAQQAEIARLNSEILRAGQRVFDTENNLRSAEIAREQAENDVVQKLRELDAAKLPLGPESNAKQTIITFGLFLFIGLLLALGGVILGTVADHSIRFPSDVRDRLGLRVLAVVPKRGSRRWTRLRGFVTSESARPAPQTTIAPALNAAAMPVGSTRPTRVDRIEHPSPAPVAQSTNGDPSAEPAPIAAPAPEVHPPHRQRRRPSGTRPSVTLRKGD